MATCPTTAANSSQPKLPWNVLPKFAIHSIFSGEPCITSTPNTFNGPRPPPYWRIMPITGTASMSRYRMPCPAAAALRTLGAVGNRPHDAQCNHRQHEETERFVQAEQAARPFRLFVNCPQDNGGQNADEAGNGQPVQRACQRVVNGRLVCVHKKILIICNGLNGHSVGSECQKGAIVPKKLDIFCLQAEDLLKNSLRWAEQIVSPRYIEIPLIPYNVGRKSVQTASKHMAIRLKPYLKPTNKSI